MGYGKIKRDMPEKTLIQTRNKQRAPKSLRIGNHTLTGCDALLVREVRRDAKKRGFDFCVEVIEEWHYGRQTQFSVTARIVPHSIKPKSQRALCGAKCRNGQTCRARPIKRADGRIAKRCRWHGGLSTGAKSVEGRARIAESNRRRALTPNAS